MAGSRRGKKGNDKAASTSSAAGATSSNANEVAEKLRRAQVVLETNRKGTLMVHDQWRSVLRKLSYGVMGVSMYQIMEWKQRQPVDDWKDSLLDWQNTPLAMFVAAAVLSFLLAIFVQDSSRTLKHPLYVMACVVVAALAVLIRQNMDDAGNFPVTIVFHPVVTLSWAFMNVQTRQLDSNLRAVQAMREDMKMQKKKK